MSDQVKARWVGGFTVVLPDGTTLHHGDEHRIGAGEAHASDNWEPVAPKPSKTTEKEG